MADNKRDPVAASPADEPPVCPLCGLPSRPVGPGVDCCLADLADEAEADEDLAAQAGALR
jgi:hypothetical protein